MATARSDSTRDESLDGDEVPCDRTGGPVAMADFQFINLDPTNLGRDKKTQTVVRKHVMRGYRRQLATRSRVPQDVPGEARGTRAGRRRGRASSSSSSSSSSPSAAQVALVAAVSPTSTLRAISPGMEAGMQLFRSFFCQNCAKLLPYSKALPSNTRHLAQEICSCPHPTPFTSMNRPEDRIAVESSMAMLLGSWRSDPFDVLPITTQHKVPLLINHYRDVIQGSHLNASYLHRWQEFLYTDAAVLHCTLYYAANHAQILAGLANTVDIYYHRGEAIRLLNERLDRPETRTSDGTIAAVASLAIFEDMFGSAEVASQHRVGLYKLVKMRGGLKNLGIGGVLERLVLWAGDVYSSPYASHQASTGDQPVITPTDPQTMPKLLRKMIEERPQNPPGDIRQMIMEIVGRLRNCFMLVSRLPPGPRRSTISFPPKFRIMSLLNERDLADATAAEDMSDSNSWLIAALLYVHIVLYNGFETKHDDDAVRDTVDELAKHLCHALKREHLLFAQRKYPPKMLVWVLLIGGINTPDVGQVMLYQPVIVRVSNTLNLSTWPSVQRYIDDLPAFQPSVSAACKALWNRAVGGSPILSQSSASSSSPE